MKKVLKWLVIGVVALVLLGALLGGGDDNATADKTAGTNGTQKEEKKEEKKEENKEFKLGEQVQVGNLIYKVEGTETKKTVGNEYLKQDAQGEFLLVKVSVTNNDKEARTIDTSLFKLVDKDGVTYDPDVTADMYVNKDSFFLKEINPKISKSGYIVFDLADAKGEYKLKVSAGMFETKEALINLK